MPPIQTLTVASRLRCAPRLALVLRRAGSWLARHERRLFRGTLFLLLVLVLLHWRA